MKAKERKGIDMRKRRRKNVNNNKAYNVNLCVYSYASICFCIFW